jgi:VanZ family protein
MLSIFLVSAQPQLPDAPGRFVDLVLKKGAHMIEYAILFLLLRRALVTRAHRALSSSLAWVLTVLYAASDEFHQTFVPGRNGIAWDVLVDGIGALLAALGVWWAVRLKK